MTGFFIGFLSGIVVTSACYVALMLYIASRSGAKVGE